MESFSSSRKVMCSDGQIDGAVKLGREWAIPDDAERPTDGRENMGQYKNWRKNNKDDN